MAKVFVFFPDVNSAKDAFLLNTENKVMYSTNKDMKQIFDGTNAIDSASATFIASAVSKGEIPKLM